LTIIVSAKTKWVSLMLAVTLLIGLIVPYGMGSAQAAINGSQIVISQVYGGGGNSGATYKNDFIELYNPTDGDLDLAGLRVRYASATGAFPTSFTETNSTALIGTIKAKGYYLVQEAAGNGGTVDLPAPDQTGSIPMGGAAGKVDLIKITDGAIEVIDLVTYSGLGATTAAIRKPAPGATLDSRGLDTDSANDFEVLAPAPRNSSYVVPTSVKAAGVTASPVPNAWPAGTQISVSLGSATVGTSVYSAVNESTYEMYSAPLSVEVPSTIKAYATAPGYADSDLSTFEYSVLQQTDIAATRTTPDARNVSTQGVLTHIDGREAYIQDDTGGIVLFDFPLFAQIGDRVQVSGEIDIFRNLQEIKPVVGLSYSVVQENAGVPSPLLLTAEQLTAANGEQHEAELVMMEDVTITAKNGNTVTAEQNGQTFTIFSGLSKLVVGKTFERITGVIKQFDNVYQFIPLSDNALVENLLSVTATPTAGKIIIGSQVTLTSPTAGAAIHFTTDGSTPTAESALYDQPIIVNQDMSIKAIAVKDGQTSGVYTFNYVATQIPRIHDIQGESHTSGYAGQIVEGVEGIVTQYGYTFANGSYKGFFIQDPTQDANLNTSEAIFVFTASASLKPAIGDLVSINGTVTEFNESSNSNLTSTQITLANLRVLSSGHPLPPPVLLGKAGRTIPSSIIDNDGMTSFDPAEDAIDFYESLEGMRVELPNPTILSPYWTSGTGTSLVYNIPTRVENDTADMTTPAGGLVLKEQNNLNPQRLLLAYGDPGQQVNTGDTFDSNITGVIGYNFGNYKVIPALNSLPAIVSNTFQPEASTIVIDNDKLSVASYNIENFNPGVGAAKISRLAESIVANLKKPDIIGLVEVQDNSGETDNGVVEADQSYAALIQAIEAAGGPVYNFTDIAPVDGEDGGAPGANIRVGFLYNPNRVSLSASVNGTKGDMATAVGYEAAGDRLTYNPGRIDPTNLAFAESRKPLAAQFEFLGQKVIVIANHFNSKTGDNGPFGRAQPPVLSSEIQRHQIAAVVNGFVKGVLTANPEANIVVLGDLNDFQFTQTAAILKGNELDNLIEKLPPAAQYTYTFDGNSQVLDHILVSKNLSPASEVDVVHLNADFSPSKGRVSDHDPVVTQIDIAANSSFPLTVLHTNDTHANLDTVSSPNNILRRVTAIKDAKATATNPVLLDAGDVFSGTLYFNKYLGQADLEFMDMVGYDAMTFGNHEFDKGSQVLADFINNAQFPFVSSNVNFSADAILNLKFSDTIGQPGDDAKIYPAIIKEIDGQKIGLIGLTTPDTTNISSPGDVTFNDPAEVAAATVERLEAEGINKIIVLSHLGYEEDIALASKVEGIDIIVGGHTHTKLDQPVVDNSDSAPKLIVQTGEKGQFLGRLQVVFDANGVLTEWNNALISIDAKTGTTANAPYVIAEDPTAKTILDTKYKPGIQELSQTVVGTTEVLLQGERTDVRAKETNLGNLIADGMLAAARAAGTNAVIALQNGGGIRASINVGPITQGEVLTVLPFNNDLVTVTLTGQELMEALENGVSKVPALDGRFPHVAGMRFFYDSTKPENQRVMRVEVKTGGGYKPLDLNAQYEVATNVFTAKGGDFYNSMAKAYNEGRVKLLLLPDYDVFTNFIRLTGTITAETSAVEGRIIDLKGSPLPVDDTTPPVTTVNAPAGWMSTEVEVTLSATDVGSGVANTFYSINDGPFVNGSSLTLSAEGLHTISYYSVDKAGNTETIQNVQVKIDRSAPEIMLSVNQEYKLGSTFTAAFQASDTLSDIVFEEMTLKKPDDSTAVVVPNGTAVRLTRPGKYMLKVTAKNAAGLTAVMEKQLTVFIVANIKVSPDILKVKKGDITVRVDLPSGYRNEEIDPYSARLNGVPASLEGKNTLKEAKKGQYKFDLSGLELDGPEMNLEFRVYVNGILVIGHATVQVKV
jgi:2',3'-cyclic-nucleotide 2'-phosphodiesterase/3'-nucleotidase/5'-nucleotidase